jgi:hypothetical protein
MKRAITLGAVAAVLSTSVLADDEWHYLLAPYVWFAGAEGELTPAPGIAARDVDVSAIEALRDTEASFMLLFQAQKQQHGVLFDVFYSDVLHESQTDAESGVRYNAALKNTMVTTGYSYEVYGASRAIINVVGGMRYWQVDTRLTLGPDSPQRESSRDAQSWLDPLVGVDAKFRLGESPAYLSGFLGAGGASGGSDRFYDVSGHVGYPITDSIVASVGYRLFDVDYRRNAFVYDVRQEGWVLGLVWIVGAPRMGTPKAASTD